MGNSYCKSDCSEGEVNVVEISQGRLLKLNKNAAVTMFYCLACKIFKRIKFHFVMRREKYAWFVLFLKRKNNKNLFIYAGF